MRVLHLCYVGQNRIAGVRRGPEFARWSSSRTGCCKRMIILVHYAPGLFHRRVVLPCRRPPDFRGLVPVHMGGSVNWIVQVKHQTEESMYEYSLLR